MQQTHEQYLNRGRTVLKIEADAILTLIKRLDSNFSNAVQMLLEIKGRVVVCGMGKSGHIARKISSTLASTGTPSFYLHPGQACHGDLGMVCKEDVVLLFSHSGTTQEMLSLLPLFKRLGVPLIAVTGNSNSLLAQNSNIHLDVSIDKEACPLALAPTTSTSVALAMGDALAMAVLEAKGFTSDDFAMTHPAGNLGRRLLLRVSDIMHTDSNIPAVSVDTVIRDALVEMTQKRLGLTTIVNQRFELEGIYTDGDLRRTLDQGVDIHRTPVRTVMTTACKTATPQTLVAEALHMMEKYKITCLVVTQGKEIKGILHMHDILEAGVI